MPRWLAAACAALTLVSTFAGAQTVDLRALSAQLKQGVYVIVFRHDPVPPATPAWRRACRPRNGCRG
jgi:hypothetical protein